ncbi:zinc-ribbon domain-containing protein [uncultured Thomasclavelia sp.]|uniref:zinc-ribbon domain-containing protein n=1 Tax=uncultured Thomasclavelia sp. TaxID=3025759 RepID=UPI002624B1B0|nr:zinc-ribbon domain-containing protein [uncultured Thomasclavelia sp.]
MKCKKCGFDNKDGALYCSQCGSKIESSKIENIKKNRIFMIAGIVVVVIAIALAIYFIFINQEPKKSNYDLALEDADTYIEDMDYRRCLFTSY